MTWLRAPLLGLVLALAACAGPQGVCGIRPFAEVPIAIERNMPLVQVRINGQAATLLLDTGAEQVLLTDAAVKRLGLATDPRKPLTVRGTGGSVTSFGAEIRGFSLAGLDIPNHIVAVLPYPLPSTATQPVDGLLGVTVLSVFDIDLDFPARKMTLYGGLVCPDTAIPPWTTPFAVLPAEVTPRGRMTIPMRVGPRLMSALVDTGTQTTVIATDAVLASGMTREVVAAGRPIVLRGAGPLPVDAKLVRFSEIDIAGQTFTNTPLIVAERQADPVDVVLGMDYLAGRRFWLSYARRRLYIAPAGRASPPS